MSVNTTEVTLVYFTFEGVSGEVAQGTNASPKVQCRLVYRSRPTVPGWCHSRPHGRVRSLSHDETTSTGVISTCFGHCSSTVGLSKTFAGEISLSLERVVDGLDWSPQVHCRQRVESGQEDERFLHRFTGQSNQNLSYLYMRLI